LLTAIQRDAQPRLLGLATDDVLLPEALYIFAQEESTL
jgi:hypothetical protein